MCVLALGGRGCWLACDAHLSVSAAVQGVSGQRHGTRGAAAMHAACGVMSPWQGEATVYLLPATHTGTVLRLLTPRCPSWCVRCGSHEQHQRPVLQPLRFGQLKNRMEYRRQRRGCCLPLLLPPRLPPLLSYTTYTVFRILRLPPLQSPRFSDCTVPLLWYGHFPFNMGELLRLHFAKMVRLQKVGTDGGGGGGGAADGGNAGGCSRLGSGCGAVGGGGMAGWRYR